DGVDIDRRTEEGAAVRVRLSFAYRIDPGELAGRAAEIESSGLRGLAASRAGAALDPMPLAALLPADPAQGSAPLPRSASVAIDRSLRAAGIEPHDLVARIGPPGSFAEAASAPTSEPTGLRVLLIGLDGADWDTIDPLMRAGLTCPPVYVYEDLPALHTAAVLTYEEVGSVRLFDGAEF